MTWNEAITATFAERFGAAGRIGALFVYAVVVAMIGVLVIVLLGRIAAGDLRATDRV